MADVSITPDNVRAGGGASFGHGIAGETVQAGQIIWPDLTEGGRWKLADCDAADSAERAPKGMALNSAYEGQPVFVLKRGPVELGAVLTPGETYFLSDNPGSICTRWGLGIGTEPTIIGIATSSSVLDVAISRSSVERWADLPSFALVDPDTEELLADPDSEALLLEPEEA